MSANLENPFGESCCDGGECSATASSAQPCGCDEGANHPCAQHAYMGGVWNVGLKQTSEWKPQWSTAVALDLTGEVRTKDPLTGGEKGSKLARFDLIPPEATWALAEHYGRGCAKYSDRNWEMGYKWGLSVAALQRHLHQWLQGERIDAETGTHHLIAVAWHAFALFTFEMRGLGTNDLKVKHG